MRGCVTISTNIIGILSHIFEMTILSSPAAIIFINNDLTSQVQSVFIRQLYLTEVITAAEFDARVSEDPNYPDVVHRNGYRVMVLRNLQDQTNRSLADMVLFAKAGLVSVESNKIGPPGITLKIDRVYLTALINLQLPTPQLVDPVPDMDDGFVGEEDNDDFDPTHMDPNPIIEPV